MPYKLKKKGAKWQVIKSDDPTADPLGEHDDIDSAKAQLSALYASEPAAMAKGSKQLSHNQINDLLREALISSYGRDSDGKPKSDCWIREIFPDYIVYSEGYGTGSLMRRDYTIDANQNVTFGQPEPVVARTTYDKVVKAPVQYDIRAAFSRSDDWVVRDGKLFEAGHYPDKHFSMLPDELDAAVQRFAQARPEVKIDLEHMPTVLDGKLGHVQDIWVDEDGISLFGRVALPRWLDEAIGEGERRVSATWDRSTKDLIGLALVLNPRVTDAALMSAFSASTGGSATAIPNNSERSVTAPSTKLGGLLMGTKDMWDAFWRAALGSDSTPEQLAGVLANASSGGAPSGQVAPNAAIGGQQAAPGQPGGTAGSPSIGGQPAFGGQSGLSQVVQYANAAATAATQQKQLQDQMDRLQAQYIDQMAVAFADRTIAIEKRAMPNERDAIITAFKTAAWDDYRSPVAVTFGAAGSQVSGTRVEALSFLYATRTPHGFTEEVVGDREASGGVLFNAMGTKGNPMAKKNAKTGEPEPDGDEVPGNERIQQLLGQSALGQAVLDSKRKVA